MKPFILDFNWVGHVVRIPSYGLMLSLAFSLGYFEALRRAIKEQESPHHVERLFLILITATVFGSRLFHVIFEDPVYYFNHPAKIFAVWEGGYTFYGGLLLGLLGIYGYCRKAKLEFLRWSDLITPSVLFGVFLGRFGCFLAGCCWGKPTEMPWGVVFSNPISFASDHVHALHPTQLYESIGGLILAIVCWVKANHRRYNGQILFTGLIGYSFLRFVIEFYRGDDYRGFVFGGSLSYAQLVSLTLLPFTLVGMFLFSRLKRGFEG